MTVHLARERVYHQKLAPASMKAWASLFVRTGCRQQGRMLPVCFQLTLRTPPPTPRTDPTEVTAWKVTRITAS